MFFVIVASFTVAMKGGPAYFERDRFFMWAREMVMWYLSVDAWFWQLSIHFNMEDSREDHYPLLIAYITEGVVSICARSKCDIWYQLTCSGCTHGRRSGVRCRHNLIFWIKQKFRYKQISWGKKPSQWKTIMPDRRPAIYSSYRASVSLESGLQVERILWFFKKPFARILIYFGTK